MGQDMAVHCVQYDWKKELSIRIGKLYATEYRIISDPSEANGWRYVVEAWIKDGNESVRASDGDGKTLSEAEQLAAQHAYTYLAPKDDPKIVFRCRASQRERGFLNEDRVMRVIREKISKQTRGFPRWLLGIEWATYEQDHYEGTDLLVKVHGEPHDMRLQVKSSRQNMEEFRYKHPGLADVAIVVVDSAALDDEVAWSVVEALNPIRRRKIAEKAAAEYAQRSSRQ